MVRTRVVVLAVVGCSGGSGVPADTSDLGTTQEGSSTAGGEESSDPPPSGSATGSESSEDATSGSSEEGSGGPPSTYIGCGEDPDCVFSTDFDALADWEACTTIECSAGQVCRVNAWGSEPDDLYGCTDHPLAPTACEGCDPVPDNWSVYRSEMVSGGPSGRSCRIGAQTVADLPDRSGEGKMFVHRVGRNSGNSANDCDLMWWDADEQWAELWTIYSFRADPAAREFFASDRLGSADHDMKHVRIGHYKGDGTNATVGFFNFNFSPYSHANAGVFIRKNAPTDDFFYMMQGRCYTEHSGGQCEPYRFFDEHPNLRGIRACADEPANPFMDPGAVPSERNNIRTCAPAISGEPWPGSQLDTSQCTNDRDCTAGALIEDGSYGGSNPDNGDGFDHFMAGGLLDGRWHTVMFHATINTSVGAYDGAMDFHVDGIKYAELAGVPFFDPGTPPEGTYGTPATGWNWVMLGGNTRGTWVQGYDLPDEIDFAFDDWCVATTRESAEACHAAFLWL